MWVAWKYIAEVVVWESKLINITQFTDKLILANCRHFSGDLSPAAHVSHVECTCDNRVYAYTNVKEIYAALQ